MKILIVIALILIGIWFYTSQQELVEDNALLQPSSSKIVSVTNSSFSASSSAKQITDIKPEQIVPDIKPEQLTLSQYEMNMELPADYKAWKQSRGIFSEEDLVEYEGFKLDKLEEFANKGDLKAIKVLSNYELSSGNIKRYKELVDLGAVHGSLSMLRILSGETKVKYMSSKKEEDLLEALAYMELLGKRGDLYMKDKIPIDHKIFSFYPTEEQQKFIDLRAEELLANYEKRREELGLPPFDNSPLESHVRRYETSEK